MTYIALGINHKTAPIVLRERMAVMPERHIQTLKNMQIDMGSREVALLSTCNRSEIYLEHESSKTGHILEWLSDHHHIDKRALNSCVYVHQDQAAVRHLMRVACGLDSMVLGEPQILGQLKQAYGVAKDAGTLGPLLNRLFQATFRTAKTVRTDTRIGESPVSVAYAAVSLARQIFSEMSNSRALLIGAGETIRLVARHLRDNGIGDLYVANRTLTHAQVLSDEFKAQPLALADIERILPQCDMVISSTSSPLPIVGKGLIERSMRKRKYKPMFLVDLAIPRDIEPEVAQVSDVYLYTLDDLHDVIDDNVKHRQEAAHYAEAMVQNHVEDFTTCLKSLPAVGVLSQFRKRTESMRDQELKKALLLLNNGHSPEEVLTTLANHLTNQFLHAPSVQIKALTAQGQTQSIELASRLFALHEPSASRPSSTPIPPKTQPENPIIKFNANSDDTKRSEQNTHLKK